MSAKGCAFRYFSDARGVGGHLGLGRRLHDLHDRREVGELGGIAGADEEVGGQRHIAGLGEPAADVLDPLVDAEDLGVDEDHRVAAALGGSGEVAGDLAVAGVDLDRRRHQATPSVVIGSASAEKAATA